MSDTFRVEELAVSTGCDEAGFGRSSPFDGRDDPFEVYPKIIQATFDVLRHVCIDEQVLRWHTLTVSARDKKEAALLNFQTGRLGDHRRIGHVVDEIMKLLTILEG